MGNWPHTQEASRTLSCRHLLLISLLDRPMANCPLTRSVCTECLLGSCSVFPPGDSEDDPPSVVLAFMALPVSPGMETRPSWILALRIDHSLRQATTATRGAVSRSNRGPHPVHCCSAEHSRDHGRPCEASLESTMLQTLWALLDSQNCEHGEGPPRKPPGLLSLHCGTPAPVEMAVPLAP